MSPERLTRRPPLIRAWTPQDDAVLLEMLHQEKSTGTIAVRLRRSISAIYTRKAALQRGAVATEPRRSAAPR